MKYAALALSLIATILSWLVIIFIFCSQGHTEELQLGIEPIGGVEDVLGVGDLSVFSIGEPKKAKVRPLYVPTTTGCGGCKEGNTTVSCLVCAIMMRDMRLGDCQGLLTIGGENGRRR